MFAHVRDQTPTRPHRAERTKFVERDLWIDGVRIRYVDEGPSHGVPLVLVHGLSSRLEEYESVIETLREHTRVIVPDLPGSGYSDKPDQEYSLASCEEFLLKFLDALAVEKVDIGGGSMGGNIALRLAHRHPARFSRVVAWAPAGAWDTTGFLGSRFMNLLLHTPLRMWLFWIVLKIHSRFWYAKDWPQRNRALADGMTYYREVACRGFVRMYFDLMADQLQQSHFPYAHEIHQPTLLLWGDQDHALNMGEGLRKLVTLLPRAELHVFQGVRHSLAAETPTALAERIHQFLRQARASICPPSIRSAL